MEIALAASAGFLLGLIIGLVFWIRGRNQSQKLAINLAESNARLEQEVEKNAWTHETDQRMQQAFKALASEALQKNSQSLTERAKDNIQNVVAPLGEKLKALDNHVNSLEKQRVGAYEGLMEQLSGLKESHAQLQKSTTTLGEALKSPTVRGRWGEIQTSRSASGFDAATMESARSGGTSSESISQST